MQPAPATTTKGLDVGTSRVVLALPDGKNYRYKEQLNAFVTLPNSKFIERMLRREGILFEVQGSEILAYGNRVHEFANLQGGETRRPMQAGVLNPAEPKGRAMMQTVLREVCRPTRRKEKICFSVPCTLPGRESEALYHERTIQSVLEDLGYKARSLNEGMAVVYAELAATNFTGIGMSFGGGMCNICVAFLGLPVVTLGTSLAGDHIDRSAASVTGQTVTSVRTFKEDGFTLNGLSTNGLDQALAIYYDDVIRTAVDGLGELLSSTQKLPKFEQPIPVAIGGGSAKVGGFEAGS